MKYQRNIYNTKSNHCSLEAYPNKSSNFVKSQSTVQSLFSHIKFSDNLWFSDYFSKTIFQSTT